MKIIQLQVGQIGTNCYIVYDEISREGAVIDPGDEAQEILGAVQMHGLQLRYILLTHAHFDHVLAAHAVQEKTGAQLLLHSQDVPSLQKESMVAFRPFIKNYMQPRVDTVAQEGTTVCFGNITATYLHTPGHTPGSSVIRMEDCLFTGDTLFRHECGRCDLPGGDFNKMLTSLKRLSELEGDYRVLPGHEATSTLAEERRANPYMKQAMGR